MVSRVYIIVGKVAFGYVMVKNFVMFVCVVFEVVNFDVVCCDLFKVVFVFNFNVFLVEIFIFVSDIL